jgi:hypothetical protein
MLGLFGAKSTHPLADAKEAKGICAELAALATRDPGACVDQTAGWLESLAGLDGLPPLPRFRRAAELGAAMRATTSPIPARNARRRNNAGAATTPTGRT